MDEIVKASPLKQPYYQIGIEDLESETPRVSQNARETADTEEAHDDSNSDVHESNGDHNQPESESDYSHNDQTQTWTEWFAGVFSFTCCDDRAEAKEVFR